MPVFIRFSGSEPCLAGTFNVSFRLRAGRFMVILGVDPGSNATGYGIVKKNGARSVHVASGVIRASSRHTLPQRLLRIHDGLAEVVRVHNPSVMVVESLFHGNNSQSFMKLSQARGVVLLLGEMFSMDIFEYAPR